MPRLVGSHLLLITLLGASAGLPALAEEQPQLIARLLTDDPEARRSAIEATLQQGADAAPALLAARAKCRDGRQAALFDGVLEAIARGLASDLVAAASLDPEAGVAQRSVMGGLLGAGGQPDPVRLLASLATVRPISDDDDWGDLGSSRASPPRHWLERRLRAQAALSVVLRLGPALASLLPRALPPKTRLEAELLRLPNRLLLARARLEPAGLDVPPGLGDLAASFLARGLEDPSLGPRCRAARDAALGQALELLDDPAPARREWSERLLLGLGTLARPALQAAARDPRQSLHARETARRLARWIRFGLDRELVRRLGDDFHGYDERPYRERRRLVSELERVGGSAARPALAALLTAEPTKELRALSAVALARQGDLRGLDWLASEGKDVHYATLSPRLLGRIRLQQGLDYLRRGLLAQALRELREAGELAPEEPLIHYNLACAQALAGELEPALRSLETAIERGFDDAEHMAQDPDLNRLRALPAFAELLRQLRERSSEEDDQ